MRSIQPRTAGFTTLEMIVVLVMLGVFAVAFGYMTVGRTEDAKVQLAKTSLMYDFPQAIFSYYAVTETASISHIRDITNPLVARGVKGTTPWGDAWNARIDVTGSNAGVYVDYPIGAPSSRAVVDALVEELGKSGEYPAIKRTSRLNGTTIRVTYGAPQSG